MRLKQNDVVEIYDGVRFKYGRIVSVESNTCFTSRNLYWFEKIWYYIKFRVFKKWRYFIRI